MALVCSSYHWGSAQSSDMAWHWWLTSQDVENKGSTVPVVDSSLQLSIFAQPWVWQALLSFHHRAKHAHPHIFSSYFGQDGNQGSTLTFRPLPCKDKMPKIWNKYSEKRNIGASVPIFTVMCLWAKYIFPQWVCLFCWMKYVDWSWEYINRSKTHECGNWGWGRAIPRIGIYKRNCRCSVSVLPQPVFSMSPSPVKRRKKWTVSSLWNRSLLGHPSEAYLYWGKDWATRQGPSSL